MPSVDSIWQIAASVAVALAAGSGFLAWNAPRLYAQYASCIASVTVAISAVGAAYLLGIGVALTRIGTLLGPNSAKLIARADASLALPWWLPWTFNVVLIWLFVLLPIATYRTRQQGQAKQ